MATFRKVRKLIGTSVQNLENKQTARFNLDVYSREQSYNMRHDRHCAIYTTNYDGEGSMVRHFTGIPTAVGDDLDHLYIDPDERYLIPSNYVYGTDTIKFAVSLFKWEGEINGVTKEWICVGIVSANEEIGSDNLILRLVTPPFVPSPNKQYYTFYNKGEATPTRTISNLRSVNIKSNVIPLFAYTDENLYDTVKVTIPLIFKFGALVEDDFYGGVLDINVERDFGYDGDDDLGVIRLTSLWARDSYVDSIWNL